MIKEMMNGFGTYSCSTIEYKRFQSKQAMGTGRKIEYLHLLIKH